MIIKRPNLLIASVLSCTIFSAFIFLLLQSFTYSNYYIYYYFNYAFLMIIIPFIYTIVVRDVVFATFFILLFVYTFFTQLAYFLDPYGLAIRFAGIWHDFHVYKLYIVFVISSFISIYICFFIFRKYIPKPISILVKPNDRVYSLDWFLIIVIFHLILEFYFFVSTYNSLSYKDQTILKNNKIFMYLFYIHPIILLSIGVKLQKYKPVHFQKYIYFAILSLGAILYLSVAVKSGQRTGIFVFFISLIAYFYDSLRQTKFPINIRVFAKTLFCILIMSVLLGGIRSLRGDNPASINEFLFAVIFNPFKYITHYFDTDMILFQDYTGTSLTLMESIDFNIIIPFDVFLSNLINAIPGFFFEYKSLGAIFSRVIDPYGIKGYGYYFLTEGFHAMGWYGIIYNGIVSALGFHVWQIFSSSNNLIYNRYMNSVLVLCVIHVVRGQSSAFCQHIFYSIIPAMIFFMFISNSSLSIIHFKRIHINYFNSSRIFHKVI